MRMAKPLTKEQIRSLRALCVDSRLTCTLRHAADTLDCAPNTIRNHLFRIGYAPQESDLPPTREPRHNSFAWTRANLEKLHAMCRDGALVAPTADAAAAMGCTEQTLLRRLHKDGIRNCKPRRFSWAPDSIALLESLCSEGILAVTCEEAASRIGCELTALGTMMEKRGFLARGRQVFCGRNLDILRESMRGGRLTCDEQTFAARFKCSIKTLRKAVKKERAAFRHATSLTADRRRK